MTVAGLMLSYGGAALDDYFEYVSMLLPGNGTNGAQNNTFLDSSTNNFTITRNGNTTQGTFSPYGSNWSNNFSGSNQYLKLPANTALAAGSGDFTIEAWVFATGGTYNSIYETRAASPSDANGFVFAVSDTDGAYMYNGTAGVIVSSGASTVSKNDWHHVAVSRSGTSLRVFVDGVLKSTVTNSTNFSSYGSSNIPIIGAGWQGGSDYFTGYLSNFRLVKGTAVYTATFTPPTSPLTAITNTSALTCQSNRFIDNSSNAFAITLNGTPSVQRFSPFSPSAAYSAATIGGSGYFDGTGDNLVSAASATLGLGSGNFTIEGWFYRTATGDKYLLDYGPESTNRLSIFVSSNTLQTYDSGYHNSGLTVPLYQWNHFAYVRNGTTITPYLNGVAGTTYTDSRNLAKTATWYIASDDTNATNITGYMSDVRVVVGTAVYTSAFTPPTAPLTAISGTQLLLNMTNGGVIDNAMMNDLETVGNAQISTTQSKFGGSSIYLDGTGDWLVAANQNVLNLGSSDFTVEAWVYTTSTAQQCVVGAIKNSDGTGSWMFNLNYNSNKLRFFCRYNGGTVLDYQADSGSFPTNAWTHIAVTRNGANLRMFISGTQVGTTNTTLSTLAIDAASTNYRVGSTTDDSSVFVGYIDDLRITKGYARYTANFTVPSSAFPTS